ncbi:hypothetical protein [uncultured Piscinibacter sp.]|uniref:hypothetical protein n=1 Tax=uncultured Piscinibacter sp. TaxID=1131835 RepID=UPI00263697F1|nr:hypothetical protein [uncultured Piscinibacter sp.]
MKLSALRAVALALVAALPVHCMAASIGIVTIVEGEATILRDVQRFTAAEGQRVHDGDILRTGEQTRHARVELSDGSTLDLGPGTELLLQPRAVGAFAERAATLYLARGWLKIGAGRDPGVSGIASATLDLQQLAGTAVLRVAPGSATAFVESGSARVAEPQAGRDSAPRSLHEGDALVTRAGEAASLARRPPAEMLQDLPRAFADSLPRRAARFLASPVEPGAGEPVTYTEASAWINGEPALRTLAVQRFAPRVSDRAFRAALLHEMRAHPEWHRVLFPEKYRPRPAPVARRAAPQDAPVVSLHGLMTWPGAPDDLAPNP